MTEVSGLLVDLDGVVRLWPRGSARAAALACGLPRNAVREIAYDDAFDLAHHGILTHEQWVDQVRARLRERHGPAGERAAGLWAADRGEPDPAMVRLLLRARAAGLTVGVLTNNTTAVRADLARHGLEDLFDQVANSADLGVTKPAPAAYRAALEMMDLPPARVAFTDDNPLNTTAAAYVGLHAHPYTTPDAFETFLRTLGIVLPTTTPTSGRARPGCPAGVPPAPGHAESDAHAPVRVRYLETSRTPQAVARALTGPGTVAVPLEEGAVATVTDSGRVTTWRLLAAGTDPAVAAGDLSAWTPTPAAGVTAAGGVTAEHLPPWLPDTRTAGGASAARLLDRTGWDLAQLAAESDVVEPALPPSCARWDNPVWHAHRAPRERPLAVRLGDLTLPEAPGLVIPFLVRLPLERGLWVDSGHTGPGAVSGPDRVKRLALDTAVAHAARLLAVHPPGAFSVQVVDPAGTAAAALAPLVSAGVTALPATGAQGVAGTLARLTERVDLITMALRGGAADALPPGPATAGQLLIVNDFPHGFDDRSVTRLRYLADEGPAAGVHLLMVADREDAAAYGPELDRLWRSLLRITPVPDDHLADPWVRHAWTYGPLTVPPGSAVLEQVLDRVMTAGYTGDDEA
ncbi:HAD-IA family hydrolase [Streptomyces clavuligerus]|uniref:HAD-IA family hydrolase n=1 Tax=Streptomyces clavuligerus TaxID=1901 RepID=UPI0018D19096|nr:HAD-IA family hydrolase [Streptomyces clavuligerus]